MIEHRNHMPVISATKVVYTNGGWSYDFTSNDSYRSGVTQGQILSQEGDYMMIGANGDYILNASSYNDINILDLNEWRFNNGQNSGYFIEDYDMNGDVNVKDRILWQKNNGKFVYLSLIHISEPTRPY